MWSPRAFAKSGIAALTCWAGCSSGGVDGVGGGGAGPGVAALGGGDIRLAAQPGEVEVGVAQRGHQLRPGGGADPRGVLTVGHVADVVDAVLDRPVPLQPVGEYLQPVGE